MGIKAAAALFSLIAASVALPAAAQKEARTEGFYLGGGLGASRADFGCTGLAIAAAECDKGDYAMRLFGGYQLNHHFFVEGGLSDLGYVIERGAGAQARIAMTAFDMSLIGAMPIANDLSLFGRLGSYLGKAKLSGPASGNRTTGGVTFGAGLQYQFSRDIVVRAEWQSYQNFRARNDGTGAEAQADVQVFGAGVMWLF